ncbi:MAG: response regulator [Pseudomonadota bacterium]
MRPVFLVEDNAAIRALLIPALAEGADMEVMGFAESESEAVEWISRHRGDADAVILDLFLKSGTGMGVLARVAPMAHDYPIVVLTNSATDLLRRHCVALGAESVFDKTAELDAFLQHCRALPRLQ